MTALTWQTLLLVALAYLAGCIIGFLARRRRSARSDDEPARQPSGGRVAQVSGMAEPLSAVASGSRSSSSTTTPATAREPFRRAGPPAKARPSGAVQEAEIIDLRERAGSASRFERALTGDPRQEAAPAPLADAQSQAPAARPEPQIAANDDLKRIRGIDAGLEDRLHGLGLHRFEQIAALSAADVAQISRELGFRGRIQRENWIEQAQVLAKGGETFYARRLARGEAAAASPIEDEGEPRSLWEVATQLSAATVAADASLRKEETANIVPAVAEPVSSEAEEPAFREEPNEVEEAVATPEPVAASDKERAPVREEAAIVEEPADDDAAEDIAEERDDLQRISTIDAEMERLLNAEGIVRYAQIADWSPADVERYSGVIGQSGRIAQENWIEQAQILARGGDTAYSREYDRRTGGAAEELPVQLHPEPIALAAAEDGPTSDDERPVRTSDVAALRSVRSQALRGSEPDHTASREGAGVRVVRAVVPDDLKRIRGIGVLIEKRLNAMGVTAYEQIANWTAADIERVSSTLDFKGRIERENWVEQARILASGGQTEFSRRFDRGEAMMSRPR